MASVVRFSISMEKTLLEKFDRNIEARNYLNRSEAIRDLIRNDLIKKEWREGEDVAGAITMIYDHHRRNLLNKITRIQHDYQRLIMAAQHIHLTHENCLEIVAVRGKPSEVQKLSDTLGSIKGIKHVTLSMSSTGEDID